jgi:predicted nucleotidyltransferase
MTVRKLIHKLSDQIAREFRPERIILFGSHAYGRPGRHSDIDLLVILPFRGRATDKAIEIRRRLPPYVPLDLVVRTPRELKQRLAWGDFFLREITEKGRILYEAPHG